MRSHEIDYELFGNDMQAVEIELDPEETVIAEAGAMGWMDDGITFSAKLGDGSDPGGGFLGNLINAGKRALAGDSFFLTHFTNEGSGKKRVAFAAPHPGRIVPIHLPDIGGELLCQRDAFLCAALGTKLNVAFTKRLSSGFFGGEGFILQRLSGDGMAFIHAGGTVVEKQLNNERFVVDTGSLVGFTPGIDYSVKVSGGLKSVLFSGEGLFLTELQGTGKVYLQTMPFPKFIDRIANVLPGLEKQ